MSRSHSSILICPYYESASSVGNTLASPKLSMHLTMPGKYKAQSVKAFYFHSSMQKQSEPSFSGANKIGAARSVVAGSITFLAIIRLISAAANRLAVGPTKYGAECTGLTWSLRRSTRYLDRLIRPRCPSRMLWNSSSISKKVGRWVLNLANN